MTDGRALEERSDETLKRSQTLRGRGSSLLKPLLLVTALAAWGTTGSEGARSTFSQSSTSNITELVDGLSFVVVGDIDGDEDVDVMSASATDGRIVWYENLDGKGSFDVGNDVTASAFGVTAIALVDLDGDWDLDVVSISSTDGRIFWYQNTDRQGHYSDPRLVGNTTAGGHHVVAADIDGDGDNDVVAASTSANSIVWFENTDGLGTFAPSKTPFPASPGAAALFAADLDTDEDVDVIIASWGNGLIMFNNTDGNGTFLEGEVLSSEHSNWVYATDMDWNWSVDLLSASTLDSRITWYQQTNWRGAFSSGDDITISERGVDFASVADMNDNGELDIVFASKDRIGFFKKGPGTGNYTFGANITTLADAHPVSVAVGDLNGDGYNDVIAGLDDDSVVWYLNDVFLDGQDEGIKWPLILGIVGGVVVIMTGGACCLRK